MLVVSKLKNYQFDFHTHFFTLCNCLIFLISFDKDIKTGCILNKMCVESILVMQTNLTYTIYKKKRNY